ncbi:hypothetical protein SM017_004165 [Cronobacter turicensis]|nr:hypothetical protein [Cronobacter turicensis]
MNKFKQSVFFVLSMAVSIGSFADVKITSPNGSMLIFSQKKQGDNIDPNAWSKIYFIHGAQRLDLSRNDRYYTEDGSSKVSPSGQYLKITSIAGDYVAMDDGSKKYVDRAYCSVIDMKNGCVVSDWDGEACGYDWEKGKDVLSESLNGHGDKFDFLSFRPKMKELIDPLSSYSLYDVNNLLRCDAPNNKNINEYQKLMKENPNSKKIVSVEVVNYLNSLKISLTLDSKTQLYSSPSDNNKTKGYLISGDKVKIIQVSPDKKWANVGYINAKGTPLIAWIKQ